MGVETKIRLVAEMPLGLEDIDKSISVRDDNFRKLDFLLDGDGKLTTFYEPGNRTHAPRTRLVPQNARDFPAVQVGDFYMLFIEERSQWVGLKYSVNDDGLQYDGRMESMRVSGPYALDENCAKIIANTFGFEGLSLDEVLRAPPDILYQKQ